MEAAEIVVELDALTAKAEARRDASPSRNKGLWPAVVEWMTDDERARFHALQLALIPLRAESIDTIRERVRLKRAARVAAQNE